MDKLNRIPRTEKTIQLEKWVQTYFSLPLESRPELQKIIAFMLNNLIRPYLFTRYPLLFLPAQEKSEGDILLGRVTVGGDEELHDFHLELDELIRHPLIVGISGCGKTNTAFLILRQLLDLDIPFLVSDWKKDYRDLLQLTDKEILYFTVGRDVCPFYYNVLVLPKETDPDVWMRKIIDVIRHVFFVASGAGNILSKCITDSYRKHAYPNFLDVKEEIEKVEVTKEIKAD